MYCIYCGKQIDNNSTFCPYCGKMQKVSRQKKSDLSSKAPEKPSRKRNSKWPWFILTALIMTAIISAVLLFKRYHAGEDPVSIVRIEDDLYTLDVEAIDTDEETGISFINNIIIIFFKPGTTKEQIDSIVRSIDGEIVGSLDFLDQYQVRVPEHSLEELNQICSDLEQQENVEFASYDNAIQISSDAVPDDPWKGNWIFSEEWSQEKPDGANWWLEAIEAMDAWDNNSYFKERIKIGVIDSGFDVGHEDLKNVITSTSALSNKELHGTHVCGIIGAEANNKKGITGLVWNCEIATKDYKLSENQKKERGNTDWDTESHVLGYTALLIEEGCKVVNLSLGSSGFLPKGYTGYTDNTIYSYGHNASKYLFTLRKRGYDFVIVQAAGNGNEEGRSVDSIHNGLFASIRKENCVSDELITAEDIMSRVIIVGAAFNQGDNKYKQCKFSNAGSGVDICAPGYEVYSTIPGGFSGSYGNRDGTSMAAPIVTGVAALVWQVNPKLRGDQVKRIVCRRENTKYTVEDSTSEQHPLVNTYQMVNASLAVQAAIKSLTVDPDEEFVWKIQKKEDNDAYEDNNPNENSNNQESKEAESQEKKKDEDPAVSGWAGEKKGELVGYDDAERRLESWLQSYGNGKTEFKGNYEIVTYRTTLPNGAVSYSTSSESPYLYAAENASDLGLLYAVADDYDEDGIAELIGFCTKPVEDNFGGRRIFLCKKYDEFGKDSIESESSDILDNTKELSFVVTDHYLIKVIRDYGVGGGIWPLSEEEVDDHELTFEENIEIYDLNNRQDIIFHATREVGNYLPDDYSYLLDISGNRYYWNMGYSTTDNVSLHQISDETEMLTIIEEKLEELVGEPVISLSPLRWENRWTALSFTEPSSVLQVKTEFDPVSVEERDGGSVRVGTSSFNIQVTVPVKNAE